MASIDRTALRLRNPASTAAAGGLHALAWLVGLGLILYVLPWLLAVMAVVGLVLFAVKVGRTRGEKRRALAAGLPWPPPAPLTVEQQGQANRAAAGWDQPQPTYYEPPALDRPAGL